MANDIDKTSPHYKGEFGSIYEVNQKFPSGGVEGDYVAIDGWAHYWNADRGTWCVNAQRDSYWDELITGIIEKFKLFKGATYMGVAGLDTVPAKAIGAKMYYFATVAGTYKNFGGLVVPQGINVLYSENGSSWVNTTLLEVAQELGVSTKKVVSQKALNDALNLKADQSSVNEALAKKANTADVDTKFTEEKKRVDAELAKKFDKASVAQESGEAEDKVMSQKAVSTKLSDLEKTLDSPINNIKSAIGNFNYATEVFTKRNITSQGNFETGLRGIVKVKIAENTEQIKTTFNLARCAFYAYEPDLSNDTQTALSVIGNGSVPQPIQVVEGAKWIVLDVGEHFNSYETVTCVGSNELNNKVEAIEKTLDSQIPGSKLIQSLADIQWFGTARIYYDDSDSKLKIIGEIPNDFGNTKVVRFTHKGVSYAINNTVKSINIPNYGNTSVLLPIAEEGSSSVSYSLSDIVFKNTIDYDTSKYIKIAHHLYSTGISEGLIKSIDELPLPIDKLNNIKSAIGNFNYATEVFTKRNITSQGNFETGLRGIVKVKIAENTEQIKTTFNLARCAFYAYEPDLSNDTQTALSVIGNGSVPQPIQVVEGAKWIVLDVGEHFNSYETVTCVGSNELNNKVEAIEKTLDSQIPGSKLIQSLADIQWFGTARIYYDDSDSKLKIIGEIPNDFGNTKVVRFTHKGVSYAINNTVKSINIPNYGNTSVLLPIAEEGSSSVSYSLSDIVFKNTIDYDTSKYIKIAHHLYSTGISEGLITPIQQAPSTEGSELKEEIKSIITRRDSFDIFKTYKSVEKDSTITVFWGDSIFGSGYKDIASFPDENNNDRYEQPAGNSNMLSIQRSLYYHLNGNKHSWRNIKHSDWSFVGNKLVITRGSMPNGNIGGVGSNTQYECIAKMDAGAVAKIDVTNARKIFFLFECGSGDYVTSNFTIKVSKDGQSLLPISSILKGKTTKKGFLDTKVFDSALDTIVTNDEAVVASNSTYSDYKVVCYNGLEENSNYHFELTSVSNNGRLWGCCYTKEDIVHFVFNNSKPGFSWAALSNSFINDIVIPRADVVILEAPMYHDHNENDVNNGANLILSKIKERGNIECVLCSCPPGGVCITGRATTILGDENSGAYDPGQNFYNYYQHFTIVYFEDSLENKNQTPVWGEEYQCAVNGKTYTFKACMTSDQFNAKYVYMVSPNSDPYIPAGTLFTKSLSKSDDSIASFKCGIVEAGNVKMERHRDLVAIKAMEYSIPFLDLLEAFKDLAKSANESLETEAWEMSSEHPRYSELSALIGNANYPKLTLPLKMNYMSNYFNAGDGHHLEYPAHIAIWEFIKNKLFVETLS